MKVLLSIKPEFVKKIFSGEKKYEYRKKIFRKDIDTIIVYSTKPEGKFVGEIVIDEILCDSPENIWDKTQANSGISKNFFEQYFNNKNEGYALKISKINPYCKPIDPSDFLPDFKAPQSFYYVDDNFVSSY